MDDEQAFLICQRNGIQLTKGPRLTREVAEAMLRMEQRIHFLEKEVGRLALLVSIHFPDATMPPEESI